MTRKQGRPPSNLAVNSNKYNFFDMFSQYNRVENGKDDSSLEAHLQKTSIGSYLGTELSYFVKIF
jgi:hypothetical protein